MNKSELITMISEKCGLLKKDSNKALDAFVMSIEENVASGERVQITGFGSFEPRTRKEKNGRNPKTMEEMVIPTARIPVFKAGSELKSKTNK
jgi:DNA-binding protein HU-beta